MTRYTMSELLALKTLSYVAGWELKIDTQDETGHGRRVWLDDEAHRVIVEERDPNTTTPADYPHATWHGRGSWSTVDEYTAEDNVADNEEG